MFSDYIIDILLLLLMKLIVLSPDSLVSLFIVIHLAYKALRYVS